MSFLDSLKMKKIWVYFLWTCKTLHWKTLMGPNLSFFRFIKYMMRDSSKMSYNEHLLSSSILLKRKGVLICHSGKKNWQEKESVSMSIFGTSPSCNLRSLHLSLHLCNTIGWSITFESLYFYECLSSHDWFFVKSTSESVTSLIVSVLLSHFFVVLTSSKIVFLESTISSPIN